MSLHATHYVNIGQIASEKVCRNENLHLLSKSITIWWRMFYLSPSRSHILTSWLGNWWHRPWQTSDPNSSQPALDFWCYISKAYDSTEVLDCLWQGKGRKTNTSRSGFMYHYTSLSWMLFACEEMMESVIDRSSISLALSRNNLFISLLIIDVFNFIMKSVQQQQLLFLAIPNQNDGTL